MVAIPDCASHDWGLISRAFLEIFKCRIEVAVHAKGVCEEAMGVGSLLKACSFGACDDLLLAQIWLLLYYRTVWSWLVSGDVSMKQGMQPYSSFAGTPQHLSIQP